MINRISSDDAWTKFTRLAEAARTRNNGFDLSVTNNEKIDFIKTMIKKGAFSESREAEGVKQKPYINRQPQKHQIFKGKYFDAYA